MSILEVTGLEVALGGVRILRGIDLEVRAGSLVAIVGANGAGKTTLLKAVSRLVRASAGSIVFDGRNLYELEAMRALGFTYYPIGRPAVNAK